MNKEELLNLVESLNMPRDEYYILGGGSLVMFGIKDKTADLDLCVSEELFARLKEEYNLDEKDKNNADFIIFQILLRLYLTLKTNLLVKKLRDIRLKN